VSPFKRLKEIVAQLRNPDGGCPWDLEQTHSTLRKYLVEETYEAIDAIEEEDDKELCSELGDVLLQVFLHAQIASERGAFTIEDIIQGVSDKMVRRHPHVFGDAECETVEDVKTNWEQIKRTERDDNSATAALKSVPKHLPSLLKASRLGDKASKVGFDWEDGRSVWEKCLEELEELQEVVTRLATEGEPKAESGLDEEAFEEELGDLLFSLSQLARHRGKSAEQALSSACQKFVQRFEMMEKNLETFNDKSQEELETAWNKAKKSMALSTKALGLQN